MMNQAANALGSNAVTNALGIDFGTILTPSKFLTKFTPSTVFAYRSLAYEIQSSKNFDVIFHWFPRSSQIRTMFANAFSAADSNEINLLVRNVVMPVITNGNSVRGNDASRQFQCSFPGSGVNGEGDLSMTFLSTEFSYVHHCFYQWLCETESPFWVYGPGVATNNGFIENLKNLGKLIFYQGVDKVSSKTGEDHTASKQPKSSPKPAEKGGDNTDLPKMSMANAITWMNMDDASRLQYLMSDSECAPFTRADIEIKMYSGNMKELHSVWFMGAFPTRITLGGMDHNPTSQQDLERNSVTFAYDSVCISSPFCYSGQNNGTLTQAAAKGFGGLGNYSSNSAEWTAGLYDDTLTQIGNTYLAKASRRLNRIMNKKGAKLSDKLKETQSKYTA